jgi:hypothetical protein
MYPARIFSPLAWARYEFAGVEAGDKRRTRRLVRTGAAMMRNPSASLPAQLQSPAALKATYNLLHQDDLTPEALIAPHCEHTRAAAGRRERVLMIQDTTEVDHTAHPKTRGLGPIGDGRGSGYLLHSTLVFDPDERQVLGLAHHEPFLRQPAPKGETASQRLQRERESQVWARAVAAIGPPPDGAQWMHMGDCGSDLFEFWEECVRQECDFLVRCYLDRCVTTPDETNSYLMTFARSLPAQDTRSLSLPARHGKPAREAKLQISFSPVRLRAPAHPREKKREPITGWVVRVWEIDPPADEEEPIEWVLTTTVATATLAEAWERVEWYTFRWLIEDYHKCLKSGCGIERRRLHNYTALVRLLGILAPMAVRLLELREIARRCPTRLAGDVLPPECVALVARLAELPAEALTVEQFWRGVAMQGGYLGRRRDGPPGWQTLWRGWLYIQTLLEGIHLAPLLPLSKSG